MVNDYKCLGFIVQTLGFASEVLGDSYLFEVLTQNQLYSKPVVGSKTGNHVISWFPYRLWYDYGLSDGITVTAHTWTKGWAAAGGSGHRHTPEPTIQATMKCRYHEVDVKLSPSV